MPAVCFAWLSSNVATLVRMSRSSLGRAIALVVSLMLSRESFPSNWGIMLAMSSLLRLYDSSFIFSEDRSSDRKIIPESEVDSWSDPSSLNEAKMMILQRLLWWRK